jgi:putative tricarboxylic transport membrane protein
VELIQYDLIIMALGVIFGFTAGLIPGIGLLIMLLLTYPLIVGATLFQMLLFYLAMASASQFSGSIVATVFGVPGEPSSLPAVIEGHKLFNQGQGNFAISNAAIGSVIGSFVSVAIIYTLMPLSIELVKEFYNNNVQLTILLISCLVIIALIGKSVIANVILFAVGFTLAMIGDHLSPSFVFLPELIPYQQYPVLYQGLPFFPLLISLYVFPVLYRSYSDTKINYTNTKYTDNNSLLEHFKEFRKHIGSSLRGSIFGTVLGLVPHIGTTLSSNLSYAFEKKRGIQNKTYKETGDIKSLVAAETANNGTSITMMVPLLMIGIPITTSEAVLLMIIDRHYYLINYSSTVESGMFFKLVLFFIVINAICFCLSWPMVRYINHIKKIPMKTVLVLTGTALVLLNLYIGYTEREVWFYFLTMVSLLPLGFLLRKTETLVLIIGFVLGGKILTSASIFYTINFA